MKKKFSRSWNKSKQTRKQRKYRFNAPLNIKSKFMGCHLSKELRGKYKKRSVAVRKGDSIKVLRGQFKGKTGKIDRADVKKSKVYITGIEITKKDGTKALYPIHPSNLIINELNLEDKKRIKLLERK
jgi:large subunit ribosomal protein L24